MKLERECFKSKNKKIMWILKMFYSTMKASKLSERFNGSSYSYWEERNNLFKCGPEYRIGKIQSFIILQASLVCVLESRDGALNCSLKMFFFSFSFVLKEFYLIYLN